MAQQFRGFSGVDALREELAEQGLVSRGYGRTRINEIWRGDGNAPADYELLPIAKVCGLPLEFFTVDEETFVRSLWALSTDPGAQIEQVLAEGMRPSRRRGGNNGRDDRARRPEAR